MGDKRKISRRDFLITAGAAGAATALSGTVLGHSGRLVAQSYLPVIVKQTGGQQLNFVTVMCDSLRYDHIRFLGNSWISTPNMDAFAQQATVFDQAYAGGFPTVLNRMELFTGRFFYPDTGWQDLPGDQVVLAERMSEAGYTTGLIFDTWHLKNNGFTFDRGFQSWQWIRGQEADRYQATPRNPVLPAHPSKFRSVTAVTQYLRNVTGRLSESDYLVAQTMTAAVRWLRRNAGHGPFYLHVDVFDPHEPWDPPQSYVDLYSPGYMGEQVIYPAYAPPDYMTAAELQHMRALYAAEVSLVDHWLGVLLEEIEALGLTANTVVILTSDHGILLGEHNAVGKTWSHQGHFESYPLYQELAHLPLMIRMPGIDHKRHRALAQPPDLMATILDLANLTHTGSLHGRSLKSYIEGQDGSARSIAVSTPSLKQPLTSKPRMTVTDGDWSLSHGAAHAPSALYHLPSDPQQQYNLLSTQCEVATQLHTQLIAFLESLGSPPDHVDVWRPPPC
jgi:arylsulfatase A-like enzyme